MEREKSTSPVPLVTFTTDFGTSDWFVGTMEGVIAGISPATRVVSITHQVSPQNIRAGAFALAAACTWFPHGTIHVAIVDPGVGSQRRAIAVKTRRYLFVGPDNGVLSWALRQESLEEVRTIENSKLFLAEVSRTFHGRDIFAPVAAHLSRGLRFQDIGRQRDRFVRLPWPESTETNGQISGEIVYIDSFGNGITNVPNTAIRVISVRDEFGLANQIALLDSFWYRIPSFMRMHGHAGKTQDGAQGEEAGHFSHIASFRKFQSYHRSSSCKYGGNDESARQGTSAAAPNA